MVGLDSLAQIIFVVSKPFKTQLHDNSSHITLILYPCNLLPTEFCTHFKVVLALHGQTSTYITNLLHPHTIGACCLSPEPVSGTRGDQAFKTTEPKLWNSRPLVLHSLMGLCWRPGSSDSLLVSARLAPVCVSHCDFMLILNLDHCEHNRPLVYCYLLFFFWQCVCCCFYLPRSTLWFLYLWKVQYKKNV